MNDPGAPAATSGGASFLGRLRRQLWQPPRAHGEQPRERTVGPLELFYDLVVVVLVAQAAHHLAGKLTVRGVGEYAAVFGLIWIAWVNGSLHHELHGREDARGRVAFLVQILVLVPLGALIPEAAGARGRDFAVTAAVLFLVLAALWLSAAQRDERRYRRFTAVFVAGTVCCAAVLGVSALLPAGTRIWIWGLLDVLYLVGFAFAVVRAAPLTLTVTDALIERFGLLIIIVLGETVTGVVTGLQEEPVGALTLAVGLLCVVVGFAAWWTYFDFAGHREPRETAPATLQWMLAHLPLTAAVAAMGAAMVDLIEHAHDDRAGAAVSWVLCGGAALVLAGTVLVAASLQAWRVKRYVYRPVAVTCALVALACLALAVLRPAPLVMVTALVLLFAFPWGVAVTRRLRHEEEAASAQAPGPAH